MEQAVLGWSASFGRTVVEQAALGWSASFGRTAVEQTGAGLECILWSHRRGTDGCWVEVVLLHLCRQVRL